MLAKGRRWKYNDAQVAAIYGYAAEHGRAAAGDKYGIPATAMNGLLARYRKQLFEITVAGAAPFDITGDAVIVGDVHVPCTDFDIAEKMTAIARAQLPEGNRTLIIAGDLLNLDWASYYPHILTPIHWKQEKEAAIALLEEWTQVFDTIYYVAGNHERRLSKATGGEMGMDDIVKVLDADKVQASGWGWMHLTSGGRRFRVTHGKNYSVLTGSVGNELANKFHEHIILHHQHHASISLDRYKRYIVVDNPALVDQRKLAYVTLDDTKSPNMAKGFCMIKDGEPHLYVDGITVWRNHLPPPLVVKPARQAAR